MRRISPAAILCAALLVASGCSVASRDQARIRELEAENAALRAQLAAPPPAAPAPAPPEPEPAHPLIDPAKRAKLERAGVKVTEKGNTLTLTFPSRILFDSGSAKLKAPAAKALHQPAEIIKEDLPGAKVIVQGHTDSQPINRTKKFWKSNEELSVARAKAVAESLKHSGVEGSRITTQGFGASKPVGDNKTKDGRALNRRVEIVVRIAQ